MNVDNVKEGVALIQEGMSKLARGPLDYYLRNLTACYEFLLTFAPYQPGDRVRLTKGAQRLRRKLDNANRKLRRAGRPLEEREAPHCPTCECGGPPQIRQLCPECLGYMPCAEHPTTESPNV